MLIYLLIGALFGLGSFSKYNENRPNERPANPLEYIAVAALSAIAWPALLGAQLMKIEDDR